MPTKKRKILFILFGILSIQGAYLSYSYYTDSERKADYKHAVDTRRQATDPLYAQSVADFRARFLRTKIHNKKSDWVTLPEEQTKSAWYQKEKSLYEKISNGKMFDILVLPLQELHPSVDRVTRLMSARYIADEIRNRTRLTVMPVELVQRLLGERSYRFSDADVASLVNQYKIKKVIHLYIRQHHRNYPKTRLAIAIENIDKSLQLKIINIEVKNKVDTFDLAVMDYTPTIIPQLFEFATARIFNEVEDFLPPPILPETIIELADERKSPIQQAINLQLLGMLVPKNTRYERRRFFERSLIALNSVNRDSPFYNLLKSRAYFYLYRRPVAMTYLTGLKNPEEKALYAYMNGNYPELKLTYEKIESPLFKLLAYFELSDLAEKYRIIEELPLPIGNAHKWLGLANSRVKDNDVWYSPGNTYFFRNIEGAFPEFDLLYTELLNNKAAIGELNKYDYKLDTIFETAFQNYANNKNEVRCCQQGMGKVYKYDIALLYRTIGISNLLRKLNKYVNIQARISASEELYNVYETIFDGHVGFLRLKAEILDQGIGRASETEKTNLVKAAFENADLAYKLTAGTDKDAFHAFYLTRKYIQQYNKLFGKQLPTKLVTPYSNDYPTSYSYGHSFIDYFEMKSYTHTDFNIFYRFLSIIENNSSKSDTSLSKEQLINDLKNRFNGHPAKVPFHVETLKSQGDFDGANRILSAAVESKTDNWEVYRQLGWSRIFDGEYDKAKEVFLKYPEFSKKSPDNSVALSNIAYEAGSILFWRGAAEQSREFYQYAADLDTGSDASLTSALRVAILDRDFLTATQISLHAAQRYNSIYRYRDYLEMLHVYGLHDRAEAGFVELAPRFDTPQIWSGKFIGQRIQDKNTNEIIDWIYDYKKSAHDKLLAQIDRFTLTQIIVDRKLADETIPEVKKIISLRESKKDIDTYFPVRSKLISYLDTDLNKEVQDKIYINNKLITRTSLPPVISEQVSVPGKYSIFISAYSYLKNGDMVKAFDEFKKYAIVYNVDNSNFKIDSQILPYIALTVKDAGKTAHFERYLKEEYNLKHLDTFDYRLANAVMLADKGDIEGSLLNLDKTLSHRPHTHFRIIYTMYQMLEISEMLYNRTKDKRYIDKALQWANYYQKIQPHVSWAYAFEAKHGRNTKRKIEAIAYTLYLDPQSRWLKSAPRKYRARAKKWWKKNTPFIIPKQKNTGKTKLKT